MSNWFNNDVAVVTGGASGNGRAIALGLAEHGADVVVADVQSEPRGGGTPTHEKVESEFGQRGTFVECDVANVDDLQDAVAAAENFGGVSVMVNNAGISHRDDFLEVSEEQYHELMDINLKGTYFGSQLAARSMVEDGREGAIVNISSISGIAGRGDSVRYCASKGGVRTMTYALAASLGPRGIRVNAVCPGVIETQMTKTDLGVFDEDDPEEVGEDIPVGRVGQASDVADAVLYLAGPMSGFVNGEDVIVDGGATNTWS